MFESVLQVNLFLAQGEGNGGALLSSWILPILPIAVLFYFMILRPEQRRQQETQQLLANLKKNDWVETEGGLRGSIVINEQGSDEVVLRIDENTGTRLHVRRNAITRVISAEKKND